MNQFLAPFLEYLAKGSRPKRKNLDNSLCQKTGSLRKPRNLLVKGLQLFVSLGIFIIPTINLANPIIPFSLTTKQTSTKNSQQFIQVALPDFVLVSLKTGEITSGDFINLNDQSLIIGISGYVKGIPLTDIETVVFKEAVWIPKNQTVICRQNYQNCYKIQKIESTIDSQKTWSDIPLSAFNLPQGAKTGLLKIQESLAEEDWQNLVNQANDIIHIVDKIEIKEDGSQMIITATPTARSK
ncbi:MAG: hypothetical protein AAGF26_12470 [Cyanobacteria bacterium P01_G01_bin.49]